MFKRFLDDIFTIFCGTVEELHHFHSDINKLHPNIKFTLEHTAPHAARGLDPQEAAQGLDPQGQATRGLDLQQPATLSCGCAAKSSLSFLDTACTISEGRIVTDLYRKPTDRNMYLLPSSCHPAHTTASIPYSLALRIIRICSREEDRDRRLEELKTMLLDRDYKLGIVNAAIRKAKAIPRLEALKKVVRSKEEARRPVMVVTYDPRLPAIPALVTKHWRAMCREDPYLREVFQKPPLVAYRKQKTTGSKIIRAKLPEPASRQPRRLLPGMKKCSRNGKGCSICPWVREGRVAVSTASSYRREITSSLTCQSRNILYLIECTKCRLQYLGETDRSLQERFSDHKGYVNNNKLNQATGAHFNLPGHSVSDMAVMAILKIC